MPEPIRDNIPECIDLSRAEDMRDVVHRVVACLVQGGIVGLPTETGYALAAAGLRPLSVARIVRDLRRDENGLVPMHLAVKGSAELLDWVPDAPPVARRLASRCWPGPVGLVLRRSSDGLLEHLPPAVSSAVCPRGDLVLRCPANSLAHEVLQLVPGPVVLIEGSRLTGSSEQSVESLRSGFIPDLLLEEPPHATVRELTCVRVHDARTWTLDREGSVSEADIERAAGQFLLFVCTGNTCRSPMAEALCRDLLSRRLSCSPEEVSTRGYVVVSAGISAYDGMPAADEAVEVIEERGGSLRGHSSRRITPRMLHQADWIITMTRSHRDILLSHFPELADRVRLLDASGADIDDPIGEDLDTYRRTARNIERHLERFLNELGD